MKSKRIPWLRTISFRLLLATIAMIGVDLLALSSHKTATYRHSLLDAVITTSLILTITAGLITAMLNNYVKGLHDQFIEQARRVRKIVWACYDHFSDIDDEEFQEFFKLYILPLTTKSFRAWSQIENLQTWEKDIDQALTKLLKRDNPPPNLYSFIFRYLFSLEDEMNQLGLLFVRRSASTVHTKTAAGVFYLICFAVGVIALGKLLPSTTTVNFIVLNSAAAVIIYAILELLLVLSFTLQELREEEITPSEEDHEDGGYDDNLKM